MKFNATSRSTKGTSASRRLRREGRVPAIVYGGNAEPLSLELDHNETYHAVRKEEYHSSILDLIVDGKPAGSVLLRAVQWHPYKQQVLHVDFQRVSKSQPITTKVPLHFINGDISPAVKLSSAVITHPTTEIEITCLPADLPQAIEVDLSEMVGGAVLHVSDVKLPEGVTLAMHGDVNPVIANAQVKGGGASADAGEEGEQGEATEE
ncbi:50S ribosomal protein L25/general stress protein Ctc [Yanghanlia caeni]|uniref:Large ribosomal subunit protein bL25 n=1 Tax=Yanghanlia caeni TaxID=3064283 RepID=A0ABU1D2F1_9BURK|nr:50S ribosomal protein L25/general stress protein Ctc [Alcaligenaceae bacterium LG-2]NGR07840.1 50S ribosomal protein L25/general stress protein Ctc [bacterium SGD-2]HZH56641.1 50S ribosomal protein L25/general stress protein Ctc [Burkholderiaceae bacterium]